MPRSLSQTIVARCRRCYSGHTENNIPNMQANKSRTCEEHDSRRMCGHHVEKKGRCAMSTATGEDLAHLRQNRELPLEQLHLRLELLLVLQNISHLMEIGDASGAALWLPYCKFMTEQSGKRVSSRKCVMIQHAQRLQKLSVHATAMRLRFFGAPLDAAPQPPGPSGSGGTSPS